MRREAQKVPLKALKMETRARILIGGDVCPIQRSEACFRQGDASAIFHDLLPEFERADLSIVNLECPLIAQESPIEKAGPALGADRQCVNGLAAAHIDVVGLANNHILDHGPAGVLNTLEVCSRAGIETVGAGGDLAQARRILIRTVNGIRIGMLAFADHEFSLATDTTAGANPFYVREFIRGVRRHRNDYDYLIVLLHMGKEHYPYPSPEIQETCRFLAEEGANAVICQHSHCIGAWETYAGVHIVYGQGNLIFDQDFYTGEDWHKGYLVGLAIEQDGSSAMNIIPYLQSDGRVGARRMPPEEEKQLLSDLEDMAQQIQDRGFVRDQWEAFCKQYRYLYFSLLRGHKRLPRALNTRLHFSDLFYSPGARKMLYNIVVCQAHREVLKTILSGTQR